jgi:hypothetical protein
MWKSATAWEGFTEGNEANKGSEGDFQSVEKFGIPRLKAIRNYF